MSATIIWAIELDPSQTGLTLEIQAYTTSGFPNGDPHTPVIELGNGHYGFSGTLPATGFWVVRETGVSIPLLTRAFQPVDLLYTNPDGTVIVGSIQGDIYGNIIGGIIGNADYVSPDDLQGPGVHLDATDAAWPAIGAAIFSVLSGALTAVGSLGALMVSKLNLLSSTAHVVLQATTNQQNLTFYQGSDYTNADGGAPSWSGVWSPAELTSIAIQLHNTTLGTGVITGATGTQSGYVDVTADDLDTLQPGNHDWQLVLTTVDGQVLPPVYRGTLTVKAEP